MPSKKLTTEQVIAAVDTFLEQTTDLSQKAWKGLPISSGPVAERLGGENFSLAICAYAAENADDDRVYTWPICPQGRRHQADEYFKGNRLEWKRGHCSVCERQSTRRQEWLDEQPTFGQKWPHLVPHLVDPADADTKLVQVFFVCSDCGAEPVVWAPDYGPVPVCQWCRARNGATPGELVPRKGGGRAVQLEGELAAALNALGIRATSTEGVVTERGAYYVPVIKPDVVLPDHRIAVELDNTADSDYAYGRHNTADGVVDDQLRDQVLKAVGWRTLRIRRPEQAVDGDWPWRIETTSQSARKLAALIHQEVAQQD